MKYLYDQNHIKNMKKNYNDKYNSMLNQIVFSSNIKRNSKILLVGLSDNLLVKDLQNRGYRNLYCSKKCRKIEETFFQDTFARFDESSTRNNPNKDSNYDLIVINTDYELLKTDGDLKSVLEILKSGGALIFMFNAYIKSYSPVWDGIRKLYKDRMPSLYDGHILTLEEQIKSLNLLIKSREELNCTKTQDYNWLDEYTINDYCSLIESSDSYKSMDEISKVKFTSDLHQTIDANGGILKKANSIRLLTSKKL